MTLDEILDQNPEEQFLTADGFDEAVIGYEPASGRLVYSIEACISILARDMEYYDAVEYFEYNVLCAYVGDLTPIFIYNGQTNDQR